MNAARKKTSPKSAGRDSNRTETTDAEPRIDFEVALEALQEIVQQLERGELGLSESLDQYERGVKFLNACYGQLEVAEQRVEMLKGLDDQGDAITESFTENDMSLEEKAASRGSRRSAKRSRSSDPPRDDGVDGSPGLF